MKGWLWVGPEATRTPAGFKGWIDFALTHAANNPPPSKSSKPSKSAKPSKPRTPAKRGRA